MFQLKVVHGSSSHSGGIRNNEVMKFSEENLFLEMYTFPHKSEWLRKGFFLCIFQ